MIKKIYDFLKKVLNELDEDEELTFWENSNHKIDTDQPMNEINPATGLISNMGWDIQGNPNGTAFHSSSETSFDNDFGNSFNSDFGNSFNSDFGSSFNDDFGSSFNDDFHNN